MKKNELSKRMYAAASLQTGPATVMDGNGCEEYGVAKRRQRRQLPLSFKQNASAL